MSRFCIRSIPKWKKQNLTYALIFMTCVGIVMRKIFVMPLTQNRTLSMLNILKMNGLSYKMMHTFGIEKI